MGELRISELTNMSDSRISGQKNGDSMNRDDDFNQRNGHFTNKDCDFTNESEPRNDLMVFGGWG